MSSTITLAWDVDSPIPRMERRGRRGIEEQRRKSKLVGMAGIRDMLRASKRNVLEASVGVWVRECECKLEPPLPVMHNHAMLSMTLLSFDQSPSGRHGNNTNHAVAPKNYGRLPCGSSHSSPSLSSLNP
jgi:hypothetical protein